MSQPRPRWQLVPIPDVPLWFLDSVKEYIEPGSDGSYAARLLWQRGIRDSNQLAGFLNPDAYQPLSPFAFGEEMELAINRLQRARDRGEKVAIWGDFDADGITATSVLWDGLGQFFPQRDRLTYYVPHRFTESHGLNCAGIDRLAVSGVKLIVTCDTGSTNLEEIDYAGELGIDVIVTDHHTLPEARPRVAALINPRSLPDTHPLYHLSGVAVAYKLVEALYERLPKIPQNPLEFLLDLVAIGLIADLVELRGDGRYLAQRGIQQLQTQTLHPTRPGISRLLALCKRLGDRPTDIAFGIGPRINAISRIQGDATFGVELLTSQDRDRCYQLAAETELANTRRKEVQNDVVTAVKKRLEQLDLSTTRAIVLADSQWPPGVLGLVAGQIAQEYARPTILLCPEDDSQTPGTLARGSARTAGRINLYDLVRSQAHLLHRFGGHPFAAGLSLPVENIPLFRDALDRDLRQQASLAEMVPVIEADLEVTVAELGRSLFRELKLLEPCGMGNPTPKLLIRDCYFTHVWHQNAKDYKGRKVRYIKTTFAISDDTDDSGYPGVWWGHYKDELPQDVPCDAIAELDYNAYKNRYELRLIDVRVHWGTIALDGGGDRQKWLLDWRGRSRSELEREYGESLHDPIAIREAPLNWDELQRRLQQAIALQRPLALAYPPPEPPTPLETWQTLVGIAKYVSRTQSAISPEKLATKLAIGGYVLVRGLVALQAIGFQVRAGNRDLKISGQPHNGDEAREAIDTFLGAIEEEYFRRQYFYRVPLSTVQQHP